MIVKIKDQQPACIIRKERIYADYIGAVLSFTPYMFYNSPWFQWLPHFVWTILVAKCFWIAYFGALWIIPTPGTLRKIASVLSTLCIYICDA